MKSFDSLLVVNVQRSWFRLSEQWLWRFGFNLFNNAMNTAATRYALVLGAQNPYLRFEMGSNQVRELTLHAAELTNSEPHEERSHAETDD